ncbi:MAG: oligosaccharide flippase family protein [Gemmatimonadota bacterium]|nr:oligosaccharide flippase family protein [Gemmatimonadota bacterium]
MTPSGRPGYARVVARLTATNSVVLILGLLTGPIQARALGPEDRGELAAILVPLALVPVLLDLGLTAFIARERARGTPREVLLGTLLPIVLGMSCVGIAAAYPAAHVLAHGRDTAFIFLLIGIGLSPVTVLFQTLLGFPLGEERWRVISVVRVTAPLITVVAYVVLWASDALTVTTAATTTLAAGIVANCALLPVLRRFRSWSFDRQVARNATRFGSRVWLGTVAGAAGGRLDQLLMVPLVPSRQLGLYAVAVTTAGFAGSFVNAVSLALNPPASRGEAVFLLRGARLTGGVLVLSSVSMAAAAPLLLPLVFGQAFGDAVPMVWILLPSTVTNGIALVLIVALSGAGRPGASAKAILVSLAVSVPFMISFLPSTGGIGAAVISTGASFVSFALLARYTLAISGGRMLDLVPRKADFIEVWTILRRAASRPRS